jgi:transposase
VTRFATEAKFAMYAGVAPIPVWSGNSTGRMRLNRGGNRQLNAALYRIAITQIRIDGPGKTYYTHRREDAHVGKREAIRNLKRFITRTVYELLHTITTTAAAPTAN